MNPTWTSLGLNCGLPDVKLAMNSLIYVTPELYLLLYVPPALLQHSSFLVSA
jgi:hypothetical protein